MSNPRIGDVPKVDLVVVTNADTAFMVEWWEDEARTIPVSIASAKCQVRDAAGALVLDLGPHFTFLDNTASLRFPAAQAALLDAVEDASWDLVLVSSAGETKRAASGNARVVEGTSE